MKILPVLPQANSGVIVDDDVFERAQAYTWRRNKQGRIYTTLKDGSRYRKRLMLGRFIMGVTDKPGCFVVLISDNANDYRRENLKILNSFSELSMHGYLKRRINKTGYVGVKETRTGKFSAVCTMGGKRKFLGTYETPEAAANAYASYVNRHRGKRNITVDRVPNVVYTHDRVTLKDIGHTPSRKAKIPYTGVGYNGKNPHRPYFARITHHGVNYYLGSYATPEEAALAYNKKADELLGVRAPLNVIKERHEAA